MDAPTRLRNLLSSPFVGFAPWIVMSVIEGPERFELSASLAFACALLIAILGAIVGIRPKVLDLAGIAFFAGLIVAGVLVDEAGLRWLGRWSGELSNTTIALIALCTVLVGRPFTLEYARETVEPEYWDSPLFARVNDVITWVWMGAFLTTAIVGFLGDGPLGQPDNIWTNWIIQIAALILAARFTEWYPQAVLAREDPAIGQRSEPPPALRELLLPLAGYLIPVGIVVLAVGGTPWWVGVGLIALGGYLARRLREPEPRESTATSSG